MPSDGRCISFDASACCLSSSCVVSLFPGCFFLLLSLPSSVCFEEMVALWRSLLYEPCKHFFHLFSVVSFFSSFFCFSPLQRHHILSPPSAFDSRSFCKVNLTEVAERLRELSRCFRVYTLVRAGFGMAVYRSRWPHIWHWLWSIKGGKKKYLVTFKRFALCVEDMFRSVTVKVMQPVCFPVFHVTHMNMYASLFFFS